jgi:hypothetical protein
MTSACNEAAQTGTFRLSRRLAVQITAGPGGFVCEWDPAMPERLTAKELRRYRGARLIMVRRLTEATGRRVLVVEL